MELVEAYLARRALDYLVGFTLSPDPLAQAPGVAKSAGPGAIRGACGWWSSAKWRSRPSSPRRVLDREARSSPTPAGDEFEARLTDAEGPETRQASISADEAAAGEAVAADPPPASAQGQVGGGQARQAATPRPPS